MQAAARWRGDLILLLTGGTRACLVCLPFMFSRERGRASRELALAGEDSDTRVLCVGEFLLSVGR